MEQQDNGRYFFIPIVQIVFFIFTYEVLNIWAHKQGYVYSRGVAWGISAGMYWVDYVFIVLSTALATYFFPRIRLLILAAGAAVFSGLIAPVLDTYPYRGGSLILIGILGLSINYFYFTWRKPTKPI